MCTDLSEAAHNHALQIAIDGPAGAGKSTVGRGLAGVVGCPYLDTGLMYRAIAWLALQRAVDPVNAGALVAITESTDLAFDSGAGGTLLVDGSPASPELRSPEVDACVSQVSAHPRVRELLVGRQREFARGRCIVMVGRDIGTTVLPAAPVKLWVTASPEERARRRLGERLPGTARLGEGEMVERIRARDFVDSSRTASPLRRAEDAVVLNTDGMDPGQVLDVAVGVVRGALAQLHGTSPARTGVFLAE